MTTTYEFTAEAKCPVDGETIPFAVKVTVASRDMIPVEWLIKTSSRLTAEAIMQEPFTARLTRELWNSGHETAAVETIGIHSGVKITCSA